MSGSGITTMILRSRLMRDLRARMAERFRTRQNDRHPNRTFRPPDLLHPGQLDIQHLPVWQQKRSQRLLVSRWSYLPLRRQMAQKCFLLGTQAVVTVANALPDLIEQAVRSERWTRALFHGSISTAWLMYRLALRVIGHRGRLLPAPVRMWLCAPVSSGRCRLGLDSSPAGVFFSSTAPRFPRKASHSSAGCGHAYVLDYDDYH